MCMTSTIVDTYSIVIASTIMDNQGREKSQLLWVHIEMAYSIIDSNEKGLY